MSQPNVLNVTAHILARQQARQKSGQKSTTMVAVVNSLPVPPRISTRASRFRLVEDGVETAVGVNLDVVVVGANPNISKVFFSKQYDSSNPGVPPDCFSHDGVTPDPSVETPVSTSCAACPHNILGSKVTNSGAKSKLCADQRHLAVIPAADPNKAYQLTVPVSGMKNLREYFKELDNYGLVPEEVVTELGFDEKESYPKLVFKQKGYVPEKLLPQVEQIVVSDEVKEVVRLIPIGSRTPVGIAVQQAAAALTQAAPTAAAPAPVVEPEPAPAPAAPAVEEGYEEEAAAAAPAARQTRSAAKPKPAPVEETPAEDESGPVTASALERKLDAIFSDD